MWILVARNGAWWNLLAIGPNCSLAAEEVESFSLEVGLARGDQPRD